MKLRINLFSCYLMSTQNKNINNCSSVLFYTHIYRCSFQALNDSEVSSAVNLVELCCQCLEQHPIELSEPLLLQNLILQYSVQGNEEGRFNSVVDAIFIT